MKVSFIATVYNEEKTIGELLKSLHTQTRLPDEIVIVDGGSTDKTREIIEKFFHKKKSISSLLIDKKGNIPVGRNTAIHKASGTIVAISDAGCRLDTQWLENITKPFTDHTVDVVAGYYKADVKNVFQKCLVPYVLVMPDRVNRDNFLPASRSMAMKKTVWKKIGGFPERSSYSEDYIFAKKLQKNRTKIFFRQDAIVYWFPRENIIESFRMFFNFATGDITGGIIRPKVIAIFIRYLGMIILFYYAIISQEILAYYAIFGLGFLYIIWSIYKNYRYVKEWQAFFILPILQFTSDMAVLSGTSIGIIKSYGIHNTSS